MNVLNPSLNPSFTLDPFPPQEHDYIWDPGLIWLHIGSDTLIALAYYAIPISLLYLVTQRRELSFNWLFWLVCTFVVASGTTHLIEVWTRWQPTGLSGIFKATTAVVSLGTAIAIVPVVKRTQQSMQEQASELIRLQETLAQTTALLKERNQELDQFAYVVSHDLKAPLRAIANLSEWIEEDVTGTGQFLPDNQYQFQLLRKRVYRMEALINGLLEYSRAGRVDIAIAPVNIADLLTDVLASLSPPATFQIEISPEMPTLTTKRPLLNQVFSNLISNAIKHHHRPDGCIKISAQDHEHCHEFAVADDGPGIDRRYHEKIFVIFQTLKARDEQENTGVGLSIVKKIVESEGGSVRLDSNAGQGSTFYFTWQKVHDGQGTRTKEPAHSPLSVQQAS